MRLRRFVFPFFVALFVFPPILSGNALAPERWEKARVKIGGDGKVQLPKKVVVSRDESRKEHMLFILDASGSMWGQVSLKESDGTCSQRCKIEIAAKVLEEYVDDLDEKKVNVGLRVFGRHRELGCRDSQLVIPVGILDKQGFKRVVREIKPGHLGKTPIAFSLRKALMDISTPNDIRQFMDSGELSEGKKSIILITDGKGGCDTIEEVNALQEDLRRLGVDIVEISVIALEIPQGRREDHPVESGSQLDMEDHLRRISRSTEGQYISIEAKPSMGIEEFERQVSKSMRIVAPTNTKERLFSFLYRGIDRINEFVSTHMSVTVIPTMVLLSIFIFFSMRWLFQR